MIYKFKEGTDLSTFGKRLKAIREANNMSQRKLSDLTGISQTALSFWERDLNMPEEEKSISTLAYKLHTTTDWLRGEVQTQEPNIGELKPSLEKDTAIEKSKPIGQGQQNSECLVYKAEDGYKLDDLNLLIRHLRDMKISKDEKVRLHKRLSKWRTEIEAVVLFGE